MTMSGQLPDPRLRRVYRLEGASADWQIGLPDGASFADILFISVGARQTDGVIYETYLVE
jgi:hypothetical protein